MRQVSSSSQVDSKESSPSLTHPVADLTLKVTGGVGPDLRRSRFGSNLWISGASKSVTTGQLHFDRYSIKTLTNELLRERTGLRPHGYMSKDAF